MSMPTLCSFMVTMKGGRHALKLLSDFLGEKNSPLYSEKKGKKLHQKKWALRDLTKAAENLKIFGFQPVGSGGDMERFGGGPSSLGAGLRAQLLETHQYRMMLVVGWWLVGSFKLFDSGFNTFSSLHLQVGSNHETMM